MASSGPAKKSQAYWGNDALDALQCNCEPGKQFFTALLFKFNGECWEESTRALFKTEKKRTQKHNSLHGHDT